MNRSRDINPYIFLIGAPFALLSPLILTGKALFWGTVSLQFLPWRAYAWEVIRSGQLPLWNSLLGMGAPLLANYQAGLLYPPNWLFFLAYQLGGLELAAWSLSLIVAGHLAWAGLGMAALARSLRLSPVAQTVCGLSFGLSAYLVARSGFLSINAAAAWLPWVVLGVQQCVIVFIDTRSLQGWFRNKGPASALRLAIILAMQLLAGHAQLTWYTWLLAGAWAILTIWPRKPLMHLRLMGAFWQLGRVD